MTLLCSVVSLAAEILKYLRLVLFNYVLFFSFVSDIFMLNTIEY